LTIVANAFTVGEGLSTALPAVMPMPLPAEAPRHPAFTSVPLRSAAAASSAGGMAGNFIKTYSYTGPAASIVHVESNLRDGRNIYVDRDYTFKGLPADLIGADWLQVADGDQAYTAVDLIELAVTGGTIVTIAHDPRVAVPEWLAKQFQTTARTIEVNGRPMTLFTRRIDDDASVTLGSNNGGAPVTAHMYIVVVSAAK
jgi:beta-galactosidase